jgi:hypothetical protein
MKRLSLALAALICTSAAALQAGTQTYVGQIQISYFQAEFDGYLEAGDTLGFQLTINDSVLDTDSTTSGLFAGAVSEFKLLPGTAGWVPSAVSFSGNLQLNTFKGRSIVILAPSSSQVYTIGTSNKTLGALYTAPSNFTGGTYNATGTGLTLAQALVTSTLIPDTLLGGDISFNDSIGAGLGLGSITSITAVPETNTAVMVGLAGAGLGFLRFRRRR